MVGPNRYLGFIMIVAERDERELHSFILNWISLYQLDMLDYLDLDLDCVL